jgi:hypothetical protein
MSYPRKYPTGESDLKNTYQDWNAMVDRVNGFTPSGTFRSPYNFLIDFDDTDYYASNAFQVVYGGPDDAGTVDGADLEAVINAALSAMTEGGTLTFAGKDFDAAGKTFSIPAGVKLQGQGWMDNFITYGYIDRTGTTLRCSELQIHGSGNAAADRKYGCALENLFISGAVSLKWAGEVNLDNVYIDNTGNSYCLKSDSSWTVNLRGVRLQNADYGLLVNNTNAEDAGSTIFMTNCFPHFNGYGIYADASINHRLQFCNGWIEAERAFKGYALDISNSKIVMGNFDYNAVECSILRGNTVTFSGTSNGTALKLLENGSAYLSSGYIGGFDQAFYQEATTDLHYTGEIEYCDQLFEPTANAANRRARINGRVTNLSANPAIGLTPTVWKYDGSTSETILSTNAGSTTGTGAEQTIAHGLSDTPLYVWFTDIEDGANAYQSSAADATNIYVTAVEGKDYAWRVDIDI